MRVLLCSLLTVRRTPSLSWGRARESGARRPTCRPRGPCACRGGLSRASSGRLPSLLALTPRALSTHDHETRESSHDSRGHERQRGDTTHETPVGRCGLPARAPGAGGRGAGASSRARRVSLLPLTLPLLVLCPRPLLLLYYASTTTDDAEGAPRMNDGWQQWGSVGSLGGGGGPSCQPTLLSQASG